MANSVDPDQTQNAASDLGLHFLLRSICPIIKVNTVTCLRTYANCACSDQTAHIPYPMCFIWIFGLNNHFDLE